MNNYKVKIKHGIVEGLVQLISHYLEFNYVDMDDKLLMSVLAEIKLKMQAKLLQPKKEYPFTWTPTQAIAISIWYDDYIDDFNSQVGNKLHTISSQVKKQYT
jgi:hypothetical protein